MKKTLNRARKVCFADAPGRGLPYAADHFFARWKSGAMIPIHCRECSSFFAAMGKVTRKSKLSCRDKNDQPFLDLAESGKADLLVTGDRDVLVLAGQTRLFIEPPAAYRARVSGLQDDTFS